MVADPATIAALIIQGLGLVHKRREGRLSKQEAQELYCKIFSSLLWEIHENLGRCRDILVDAEESRIAAGVLSFFVRDALFSDFCFMCPEPQVISDLNEIYSGFERIHHWQRVTTDLGSNSAGFIIGFAKALFKRKLHSKYKDLLYVLRVLCSEIETPPEFDPSSIPEKFQ
jgi:hypothetical protein